MKGKNDASQSFVSYIEDYRTELEARDSSNNNLVMLPNREVDQVTWKRAKDLDRLPLVVLFKECLRKDKMEIITVSWLQSKAENPRAPIQELVRHYGRRIRSAFMTLRSVNEIVNYVRRTVTWIARKITGVPLEDAGFSIDGILVRRARYSEPVELREGSMYFGINAPRAYELNVWFREPGKNGKIIDIGELENKYLEGRHEDRTSYSFRLLDDAKRALLQYEIIVPKYVWLWIFVGAGLGIFAPAFALYVFLPHRGVQFGQLSLVVLAGANAALIAMRAWLFENIELLGRMSSLFLFFFGLNLAVATIIGILIA